MEFNYDMNHMTSFSYIIALLRLPNKFIRSEYIQPAKLPTDCGENLDHTDAIVAGMGRDAIVDNSRGSDRRLKYAKLQTMENKQCSVRNNFQEEYGSIICTYSSDGQAAFHGDSGEFRCRFASISIASTLYPR